MMNNYDNEIFKSLRGSKVVMPKWVEFDTNTFVGKIVTLPTREDVDADRILGYSRSLLNAEVNDAVESLYRLMDGKIEVIEFKVDEKISKLNIPLKDLKLKRNILLGGILRDNKIIIPRGDDVLMAGDAALVVSIGKQITGLEDIFADR